MKVLSNYEKEADYDGYILLSHLENGAKPVTMPHFHDSIEIAFMVEGECCMHVNSEEYTLRKGDIGFVNCCYPHFYKTPEDVEMYVVVINSQYLSAVDGFKVKTFASMLPHNEDAFERIIEFLKNTMTEWNNLNKAMKVGFANYLLGLMMKYYPLENYERAKCIDTMMKVLEYIDEHYAEPITLKLLCELFGYTQSYLSLAFNKFTDMNLREYLNRRRITAAVRMRAEQPNMPIYKIAAYCGFDSPNTFYRAYARYAEKKDELLIATHKKRGRKKKNPN